MNRQKTLYMLIGPKGAGKTHIGSVVGRQTGIAFLRVEDIWLGLKPGQDGWMEVAAAIDSAFRSHDQVIVESLGVGDEFRRFHAALAKKYAIKMIHVVAGQETCFRRVKQRNSAEHIAVSDDKVMEYNRIAAGVSFAWDLEIDNENPASDAEILASFRRISSGTS